MNQLFYFFALASCVSLASTPIVVDAATISGSLGERGVVWVSDGSRVAPSSARAVVNRTKSFVPDLLIVPIGTIVQFPNEDPFQHSIYSESGPNPFDIGFEGQGPGKSVVLSRPGVDDVRCHLHPSMRATIVAADGPFAEASDTGAFTVRGVFAGNVTIHAWTARGGVRTKTLRIARFASDLRLAQRL